MLWILRILKLKGSVVFSHAPGSSGGHHGGGISCAKRRENRADAYRITVSGITAMIAFKIEGNSR